MAVQCKTSVSRSKYQLSGRLRPGRFHLVDCEVSVRVVIVVSGSEGKPWARQWGADPLTAPRVGDEVVLGPASSNSAYMVKVSAVRWLTPANVELRVGHISSVNGKPSDEQLKAWGYSEYGPG